MRPARACASSRPPSRRNSRRRSRLSPPSSNRTSSTSGCTTASRSPAIPCAAGKASSEYFRASGPILEQITYDRMRDWCAVGLELMETSPALSGALFRASPAVLPHLSVPQVKDWAAQGQSLYKGTWKSGSLSAQYFDVSPQILPNLPLSQMRLLVELIDSLASHSYELASACLGMAPGVLSQLDRSDRAPFLEFGGIVAHTAWVDARVYFERGPGALRQVAEDQRPRYLSLAGQVALQVGRLGHPYFIEAAQALSEVDKDIHEGLLELSEQLASHSGDAAHGVHQVLAPRRPAARHRRHRPLAGVRPQHPPAVARRRRSLLPPRIRARRRGHGGAQQPRRPRPRLRTDPHVLQGADRRRRRRQSLRRAHRQGRWLGRRKQPHDRRHDHLPARERGTLPDQRRELRRLQGFRHASGRPPRVRLLRVPGRARTHPLPRPPERRGQRPRQRCCSRRRPCRRLARQRCRGAGNPHRHGALLRPVSKTRRLAHDLFTIVEDTRIDTIVKREYAGVRRAFTRLQQAAIDRRRPVEDMPARQAMVENLLRASLDEIGRIRWPNELAEELRTPLRILNRIRQEGATVQDSAAATALLYEWLSQIPNIELDTEGLVRLRAGNVRRPRRRRRLRHDARLRLLRPRRVVHALYARLGRAPLRQPRPGRLPRRLQARTRPAADEAQGRNRLRRRPADPADQRTAAGAAGEVSRDLDQRTDGHGPRRVLGHVPRQPAQGSQPDPGRASGKASRPWATTRPAPRTATNCPSRRSPSTTTSGTSAPPTTSRAGAASRNSAASRARPTTTPKPCTSTPSSSRRRASSSRCCAPNSSAK